MTIVNHGIKIVDSYDVRPEIKHKNNNRWKLKIIGEKKKKISLHILIFYFFLFKLKLLKT